MKTVREFCLGRTIIVIGAMFVWAWASQQAHSQNLDCRQWLWRIRRICACATPSLARVEYKTCLAIKLQRGLVITRNIPVG